MAQIMGGHILMFGSCVYSSWNLFVLYFVLDLETLLLKIADPSRKTRYIMHAIYTILSGSCSGIPVTYTRILFTVNHIFKKSYMSNYEYNVYSNFFVFDGEKTRLRCHYIVCKIFGGLPPNQLY